jgi:gamma-glutamyltranspeptidase/glutathione hydrolase
MAAEGVTISGYLGNAIVDNRDAIDKTPALRDLFTHDGKWLGTGDTFRNEDLSNTLGAIARDGGKSFYEGSTAAGIAAACRDVDGAVRAEDLAAYHPIWRAPVVAHWRGYDILTVPPPSSGGVVLVEMLHILEPVKFDRNGADAAQSYHLLVETMKNGFADRATVFGDPDFVEVPVDELTSTAYADKLRSQIDGARTKPHGFYGHPGIHTTTEDHGTTNVSVVDAEGNAVAITSSVNDEFGAMVVAPQTGVILNDTIDDFSFGATANVYGLVGSDKNRLEKNKRPVSSMAPTIVLQDKKVRLVAGGSGGPRITSGVLQTILGVLAENKSVDDAVDAPRVHHQWTPDILRMEPQIPKVIADDMVKRGHTLEAAPFLGCITAVEVKDGKADGAADARKLHPPKEASSAQPAATPAPKKPVLKPK